MKRVSRKEIWLSTTSVTATTTRFWNSETSEAVITVLVWSTSVIMAEMTCPARVRWKKPQLECQEVVEEPDAELAHQAFLRPHRDLARERRRGRS